MEQEKLQLLHQEIEKLTDMLALILIGLSVTGVILPPHIEEWWQQHKNKENK